jgi:hypothetical protein
MLPKRHFIPVIFAIAAALIAWISAREMFTTGVSVGRTVTIVLVALAGSRRRPEGGGSAVRFKSTRVAMVLSVLLVSFAAIAIDAAAAATTGQILLLYAYLIRAFTSDARRFALATARSLAVCAGPMLLLVAGELFCRTPLVTETTGGTYHGRERWANSQYDWLWANQPHRLRSLHIDKPKPEGVTRILVIGDSFTFGDKIWKTKDTWPYVMEWDLRLKGHSVQALNFAQPGFSTVNAEEMLRRYGWDYEPDIFILQFNLNDPVPSGPDFKREGESFIYPVAQLPPNTTFMREHSYLYTFLNSRFASYQVETRFSNRLESIYADDAPAYVACLRAIGQMADQAKQRDVPMLMVMFPSFRTPGLDDERYLWKHLHAKMEQVAKDEGIGFLDARNGFAKANPQSADWWALPWDPHPSVKAQALLGELVATRINSDGLLD